MTEFSKIKFASPLAQSVFDAAMERVEKSESDFASKLHIWKTDEEDLPVLDMIAKNRISGFLAAVDTAYKIESSEPPRPFDWESQWNKEADMRVDLDHALHAEGDRFLAADLLRLRAKYPKMEE